MTKKWIGINLVLLMATVLLGRQLYVAAQLFKQQNNPTNIARGQPAKKGGAEAGLPPPQPVSKVNEAEFAIIPGANVFTEARKPEEKEQAPAPEPVRRLDNPPVLVGIMAVGNRRLAMISDPAAGNAPGGGRRTQTMRVGDNYRGFVVTSITDNTMVLEAGASREIIPLFAVGKTPAQGKTPPMAVRVVNFGSGQTGSAAPVASSASASPGRTTPIQSPTPAPGTRGGQPTGTASQRGSAAPQSQMPQQLMQQPGQSLPNVFTDSQGRQVIQTPFGILPSQPTIQTPVKK
jgi:hypothetical protein